MKKIRKAIIPVGGYGTRMFPVSLAFPKEFMPLTKNGVIKPAIMYLLEELDEVGIEEIYIVVTRKTQKDFYNNFFFSDIEYESYLNSFGKEYLKVIKRISKKIKLVYEKSIKDFGHVLYYFNDIIKDESFLLLLGDQVYKSYEKDSCLKQIVDNYSGELTISVMPTKLEDVKKYGILKGEYNTSNSFVISKIVEKPTIEFAKNNLEMEYKKEKVYFSVFGAYVLNRKIVDNIYIYFSQDDNLNKECNFTDFLDSYDGVKIGFIPNGRYYDIGNCNNYLEAFSDFGVIK